MADSDLKEKSYQYFHPDEDFVREIQHLPSVHKHKFWEWKQSALLNILIEYMLGDLFPNVCDSLQLNRRLLKCKFFLCTCIAVYEQVPL